MLRVKATQILNLILIFIIVSTGYSITIEQAEILKKRGFSNDFINNIIAKNLSQKQIQEIIDYKETGFSEIQILEHLEKTTQSIRTEQNRPSKTEIYRETQTNQSKKRKPPKGFIGIHGGLYRPFETEVFSEYYDIPWIVGGFDIGMRITDSGLYLIGSGTGTNKEGKAKAFGVEEEIRTTWTQTFIRGGVRYMNYASESGVILFLDALVSYTQAEEEFNNLPEGMENRNESSTIEKTGLALGLGIRYKWFEIKSIYDFIRSESDSWLGGYNLTAGVVYSF